MITGLAKYATQYWDINIDHEPIIEVLAILTDAYKPWASAWLSTSRVLCWMLRLDVVEAVPHTDSKDEWHMIHLGSPPKLRSRNSNTSLDKDRKTSAVLVWSKQPSFREPTRCCYLAFSQFLFLRIHCFLQHWWLWVCQVLMWVLEITWFLLFFCTLHSNIIADMDVHHIPLSGRRLMVWRLTSKATA